MTAPGEPFTDLAKRSQEMVSSAVQSWADTVHAFAGNSTPDPTNAQAYVDTVFDFAEQVLASQREIARQWMSVTGKASEEFSQQTAQATRSAADSGIQSVQGAAEDTAQATRVTEEKIRNTARIRRNTAKKS
jgi:hypothetical protein